jgi:hypothetical protein
MSKPQHCYDNQSIDQRNDVDKNIRVYITRKEGIYCMCILYKKVFLLILFEGTFSIYIIFQR